MGNYAIPIGIVVIFMIVFYGIIIVHDIPYQIAKKRNHPHADAIHVAGWISLLFLGVIWPFLWIWAALYREDRGWGIAAGLKGDDGGMSERIANLDQRLARLEQQLPPNAQVKSSSSDEPGVHR